MGKKVKYRRGKYNIKAVKTKCSYCGKELSEQGKDTHYYSHHAKALEYLFKPINEEYYDNDINYKIFKNLRLLFKVYDRMYDLFKSYGDSNDSCLLNFFNEANIKVDKYDLILKVKK